MLVASLVLASVQPGLAALRAVRLKTAPGVRVAAPLTPAQPRNSAAPADAAAAALGAQASAAQTAAAAPQAAAPRLPTLPHNTRLPRAAAAVRAPQASGADAAGRRAPSRRDADARPSAASENADFTAAPERADADGTPMRAALRRAAADVSPADAGDGHKAKLDALFSGMRRRAGNLVRGAVAAAAITAAALGAAAPALADGEGALKPPAARTQAAPVEIEAFTKNAEYSVADAIRLTLRLRNTSSRPVVLDLAPVHEQIAAGLAPNFEVLQLKRGEIYVPPGSMVEVEIELGVIGLPAELEPGTIYEVEARPFDFESNGRRFSVPSFKVKLKSLLDADWQNQGLKEGAPWVTDFRLEPWLLALYLLLLGGGAGALYAWSKRREIGEKVRETRSKPTQYRGKPDQFYVNQLTELRNEFDLGLDAQEAYRRLVVLLNAFFVDHFGIRSPQPKDLERAGNTLRRMAITLKRQQLLDEPLLKTLAQLTVRSEHALYADYAFKRPETRAHIETARGLVGELKDKREAERQQQAEASAWFALPLSAAGLSIWGVNFLQPYWLLLLIPATGLLLYQWLKKKAPSTTAPSSEWAVGRKSLRQRLRWLPGLFLYAAMALGIGALADPTWGYKTQDRVVTSLDNIVVIDRSGSMSGNLPGGGSGEATKIEAAKEAALSFTQKQHGTTNRVGLILFTDRARLVMNLTLDYDAIENVFTQVYSDGGTDIGEALDAALSHFLEANLIDLDPAEYPAAAELRAIVKTRGFAAAFKELKNYPGLVNAVTRPDRHKAVILVTDGYTYDDGRVLAGVRRAQALGIRIYTVGVPDADTGLLRRMAEDTDGRFIWVRDTAGMEDAFAEIDRLQKALVKAHGTPRPIHHDREFAVGAFWSLLLALLLYGTILGPAVPPIQRRKNMLSAFLLLPLLAPGLAQPPAGAPKIPAFAQSMILAQGQAPQGPAQLRNPIGDGGLSPWDLSPYRELPEVRRGRALYEQGHYAQALQEFEAAAAANPDMPELPLYQAMTQERMGNKDEADALYQEAARRGRVDKRPDVEAAAHLQRGNMAAEGGDGREAMRRYRDALRTRYADGDAAANQKVDALKNAARWNYEAALRGLPPQGGGDGQGQGDGGNGNRNRSGDQPSQQGQPKSGQGQSGEQQGQGQSGGQQDQEKKDDQQQEQPQGQNGAGGDGEQGEQETPPADNPEAQKAIDELTDQKDPAGGAGSRGKRGRAWGWMMPLLGAAPGAGTLFFFTDPIYLWLSFVLVPVLAALAAWAAKRAHLSARRLASADVPEKMLRWAPARRMLTRAAMLLGALALLGASAAGPSHGTRDESFSFGGKDIVVLVDASWSNVLAEDGRFGATIDGLERFGHWLDNGSSADRTAIVPFAGSAGEAVLSNDHRNLIFQTYHLRDDAFYLLEGSSLDQAMRRAIQIFDAAAESSIDGMLKKKRQRVVIVISDGGSDDASWAAEQARAQGLTVHTLGVGSREGARMRAPEGQEHLFEETYLGGGVKVRLEPDALKELAAATGGTYREAATGQSIEYLLAEIAQHESADQNGNQEASASVARYFAAPGIALLLLAVLLSAAARQKIAGGDEREQSKRRVALARSAAARLRYDRLLHGRFRSPYAAPDGPERLDTVPHSDQPWKHVDHRVSARTGSLQARRFEQEPEIPLTLVVDVSASSAFGGGGLAKREVQEEIAEALAAAAVRENRPVGLLLVSDRIEKTILPQKGRRHAAAVLKTMRAFKPVSAATDLTPGLRRAVKLLGKRGIVAVLSDFDAADYEKPLRALGARHVLVPVVIQDALEAGAVENLGVIDVLDPETGERATIDTRSRRVRAALAEALKIRRERTARAFAGRPLQPLYLDTAGGHIAALVKYFESGGQPK